MLSVTNLGLVLLVCIISAMVLFKKKNICLEFVKDKFLRIGKNTHNVNFKSIDKIWSCKFFQVKQKKCKYTKNGKK